MSMPRSGLDVACSSVSTVGGVITQVVLKVL